MSKSDLILNYLKSGKTMTVKQGRTMFKVKNIPDAIYRLRNQGHKITTTPSTLKNGDRTFRYTLASGN